MFKKLEKATPLFASFLSTLAVSAYIFLISLLLSNGEHVFGRLEGFKAPLIMLTLLGSSVLICGLLVMGFPFYLFWIKKQVQKAIKIVGFTTLWLFTFFLVYLTLTVLKVF